MASSRRAAQLGLCAVCLVLISSIFVLVVRADRGDRSGKPGTLAGDFILQDLNGATHALSADRGKVVVLIFSSARGSVSNSYRQRMSRFAAKYTSGGNVALYAINSNAATGEVKAIDELRVQARLTEQPYAMLLDANGAVAASLAVKSNMTCIVIDRDGVIRYHGAFDDNKCEKLVQNRWCEEAVASLLKDRPVRTISTQAIGSPLVQPR